MALPAGDHIRNRFHARKLLECGQHTFVNVRKRQEFARLVPQHTSSTVCGMTPVLARISGAMMPAAPSIAHRAWITSLRTNALIRRNDHGDMPLTDLEHAARRAQHEVVVSRTLHCEGFINTDSSEL